MHSKFNLEVEFTSRSSLQVEVEEDWSSLQVEVVYKFTSRVYSLSLTSLKRDFASGETLLGRCNSVWVLIPQGCAVDSACNEYQ